MRTNKLNPQMMLGPELKHTPHWYKVSTLSTEPSLLPIYKLELSSLRLPFQMIQNLDSQNTLLFISLFDFKYSDIDVHDL